MRRVPDARVIPSAMERPIPEPPDRPIHTPPSGPPQTGRIDPRVFEAVGEAGIRSMIAELYRRLVESEIAWMFPDDPGELEEAVDRSAAMFVFLCGGPPRYQQRYGSPMMRARHLRFPIDERARLVWLDCFAGALDLAERDLGFPPEHRPGFERFITDFSAWMVNTENSRG